MTMKTLRALCLAATAASAIASPAAAQTLNDRYWIDISGYWPEIETFLTVNRPRIPGTTINAEQDLNLDDRETLPAVSAGARYGRWNVIAEYYALDRQGSATITRDLVFDGVTYPASAKIESSMRSDIYRVAVGYDLFRSDSAALGVSIGLHATDFNVEVVGQGTSGGPGLTVQNRRQDFLAPMPTLGIYAAYQATPRINLAARGDYLSMNVSDYNGSVTNVQVSAGYRFTDNLEIGAAYRYVDYGLSVEKDDKLTDVDYTFSGPSLYLRAAFN